MAFARCPAERSALELADAVDVVLVQQEQLRYGLMALALPVERTVRGVRRLIRAIDRGTCLEESLHLHHVALLRCFEELRLFYGCRRGRRTT